MGSDVTAEEFVKNIPRLVQLLLAGNIFVWKAKRCPADGQDRIHEKKTDAARIDDAPLLCWYVEQTEREEHAEGTKKPS